MCSVHKFIVEEYAAKNWGQKLIGPENNVPVFANKNNYLLSFKLRPVERCKSFLEEMPGGNVKDPVMLLQCLSKSSKRHRVIQ